VLEHPDNISYSKLLAGDSQEQHRIYKQYYGKMIGIPLRYTRTKEEAQEILNESFVKVFRSVENYKEQGTFSGWIAKIVFNTTMDHVRRVTRYNNKIVLGEIPIVTIKNDAIDNMALEEIYKKIQQLPSASQKVFSLYVIDGFNHREIAEMLNISEGTSKWHLSNARVKLQELLKNR
jgi:RNA polymerase sigma-70 factor (ECF subfamily)